MILAYCLFFLALAAAWFAGYQFIALRQSRRRFEARLSDVESQKNEQILNAIEADNRRALLRNSVDSGTSAVELVHRAVSTTTFELIDHFSKSERLRLNTRQARELHDDASRGVYRTIRVANKHVHALANVIIRQKRRRNRNMQDKEILSQRQEEPDKRQQ